MEKNIDKMSRNTVKKQELTKRRDKPIRRDKRE
jgi:hypothetical protein